MSESCRLLERSYRSHNPLVALYRICDTPWWQHLLLTVVFFCKALPLYLGPLYLEAVIEMAREPERFSPGHYWGLTAGFFAILGLNIPFNHIHVRLASRVTRRMEHQLRSALVHRLQHLAIGFHTRNQSGRLHAKVLRDVQAILLLTRQLLFSGTNIVLTVIWSLGIVVMRDWRVTLFFVVCAPAAVGLVHVFKQHMRRRERQHRQRMEHMTARVGEMINLIPVTRAHGAEEWEIGAVQQHLDSVRESGERVDRMSGWFNASAWVTMQAAVFALVAIGGWMAYTGSTPVSTLVLYHSLFVLLISQLTQLLNLTPMFMEGMEAVESLGEVLECPDLEHNRGKRRVETVRGAIRFEQVGFTYREGDPPAVERFSLDVAPGECIAFVGESGSGKSTLMNLAIGFWRPQHGRILLDGIDMAELDLRSWRRHVAVVPQHTVLFSGSVRENICYGVEGIAPVAVEAAIDAANLREVVERLPQGLDTPVGENGLQLSGGQRQRLAIARALVRDPRVIILDEATSALDVISEREVQVAIERLVAGRTTFIVAHRLSTIRHCDRVVVMKNGSCRECGARSELLARDGEFARLSSLQV
ncbi:MAG: ABC transporter ATP-binding protein [Planctomycetota bacterium]